MTDERTLFIASVLKDAILAQNGNGLIIAPHANPLCLHVTGSLDWMAVGVAACKRMGIPTQATAPSPHDADIVIEEADHGT